MDSRKASLEKSPMFYVVLDILDKCPGASWYMLEVGSPSHPDFVGWRSLEVLNEGDPYD